MQWMFIKHSVDLLNLSCTFLVIRNITNRNSKGTSQVALEVKKKYPPANAGDARDASSIPELGRSPGEGHGNPLQYSCLENAMDRGAWRATYSPWSHKESAQLKQLNTHTTGCSEYEI